MWGFTLPLSLRGSNYYDPHFPNQETESQIDVKNLA